MGPQGNLSEVIQLLPWIVGVVALYYVGQAIYHDPIRFRWGAWKGIENALITALGAVLFGTAFTQNSGLRPDMEINLQICIGILGAWGGFLQGVKQSYADRNPTPTFTPHEQKEFLRLLAKIGSSIPEQAAFRTEFLKYVRDAKVK